MALTAMPGWTATDMFARPPRAVVRHAPAGGVMMHAACTFIPGWTWTTAFGGPGTVGGSATAPPKKSGAGQLRKRGFPDYRSLLRTRYRCRYRGGSPPPAPAEPWS